jgi:hypothetical protein
MQHTLTSINALLRPFTKLCKYVLSQNAHFNGGQRIGTADAEKIEKYIKVFASSSKELYKVMLANTEDVLDAIVLLTVALEKDLFDIDKRQYSVSAFDAELFHAHLRDYRATVAALNELEANGIYNEKLQQRQELEALHDEASHLYETSLGDQGKNLKLYHNIIKSYKALRHHVAECCYRDFHQRVELAAPPMSK